jgi:protein-L-isoaspartate(D-aspartate) O-methyltransferase
MLEREDMVKIIREVYGLDAPEVENAMIAVPREQFVDKKYKESAYEDGPVPIGYGQTVSQPYTVAFMTHLLGLKGNEKVLEIGTGSGYQAAILAELAREVYTMEIVAELAERAERILGRLGYKNVWIKAKSGKHGWSKKAPFDAILVTAGVEGKVPSALFNQLKKGGVLVAPVGKGYDKKMTRFTKTKEGKLKREEFGVFHFVPFVKE